MLISRARVCAPLGKNSRTRATASFSGSALETRTQTKSAPAVAKSMRSLAIGNVECDAGNLEQLAPPGDEIALALRGLLAVFDVGRNAEGDVVGAGFANLHCLVTAAAGIGTDDGVGRSLTQRLELAERCPPTKVHARRRRRGP